MTGPGPLLAKANRAFMHRATHWLADNGVSQFLDIGTGIPTAPNLHQIAQQRRPEARVVYCDNDPIVLAHAAALLHSTPEGVTEYVQADVRDPATILEQSREILDFDRPIALCLVALLHFVSDEDGAHELVDRLIADLPSGSYLMMSHSTGDFDEENTAKVVAMYRQRGLVLAPRGRAEVARFFTGLELVEPGVSLATDWHPELGAVAETDGGGPLPVYGAVARKL